MKRLTRTYEESTTTLGEVVNQGIQAIERTQWDEHPRQWLLAVASVSTTSETAWVKAECSELIAALAQRKVDGIASFDDVLARLPAKVTGHRSQVTGHR